MLVLVVEDETSLAERIGKYLSRRGFAVDFATTGEEGG
jgi:DNA-binding response OmpR family regulator